MNPEDILWRMIDRLQESKEIFASSLEGLHPVKDKELIDAITRDRAADPDPDQHLPPGAAEDQRS